MAKKERIYDVSINHAEGTAENELFKKMLKKGDVASEKIKDVVGAIFTVTGIASVTIKTEDNNFDLYYYITDCGIFTSGSEIFYESVTDYYGEVDKVKVVEIKTKKGTTYKAVPIF